MKPQSHDSDDLATIQEIIRAKFAPEPAEQLLNLVRPSVAFTVRADATDGRSAIGGAPRTTEAFDWPDYQGRPMILLAQVDCSQVAPLIGPQWTLPSDGYLLFFHDGDFAAEFSFDLGDDGCAVIHVATGHGGQWKDDATSTIPLLPLEPRFLLSVPSWADAEAERATDGDIRTLIELDGALSNVLTPPRHRLLGWCDSGDTPHPHGHRPLLQLETEAGTDWGEIVNVSFWIREEYLRVGDFSRVRRSYEVA
jgi:hypothetical protein